MTFRALRPLRFLFAFCLLAPLAHAQLAFSEYVEGSAFNKALEIYNFSQASVDLSRYRIDVYGNGSAIPTATIALDAVHLSSGGVWVVAHPYIDPSVLPQVNQVSDAMTFSGDDVVVLRAPWGVADAVGEIGVDPGTHWGTGAEVTMDATLHRNSYDCEAHYRGIGPFDPAATWTGAAQDDFDLLGIAPLALRTSGCTFALATYRNPSYWGRVNPAAYQVASLPILGSTFTATIDTTGKAGAYLVGYSDSLLRLSNWGNILVDYTQPPGELLGMMWGIGDPVVIQISVPLSPSLVGYTICTQAVRFGAGVDLTNAQDLRFGY